MLSTSSPNQGQHFLTVYSRDVGIHATCNLIMQLISHTEFLGFWYGDHHTNKRVWDLENFINFLWEFSLVSSYSSDWLKMNQHNFSQCIYQKSLVLVLWQCVVLSLYSVLTLAPLYFHGIYESWWLMSQLLDKCFKIFLQNLLPRIGGGKMCARRVFCAHFPNEVVMPSVLQVVELEINSFKWLTQWAPHNLCTKHYWCGSH